MVKSLLSWLLFFTFHLNCESNLKQKHIDQVDICIWEFLLASIVAVIVVSLLFRRKCCTREPSAGNTVQYFVHGIFPNIFALFLRHHRASSTAVDMYCGSVSRVSTFSSYLFAFHSHRQYRWYWIKSNFKFHELKRASVSATRVSSPQATYYCELLRIN